MVVTKPFNVGVQYGLESTWGTAVARDTAIGRVRSANIQLNNNPIPITRLGSGRNKTQQLYGPLDVSWNMEFELHDAEHLRLVVGPRTGLGTDGSPYILNEATEVSSSDYPPFTLEVASNAGTDEVQVAEGCVANEATINFSAGAPAVVSMSGVAETFTNVTTATSYTEPTTTPFIFSQITVKWGGTPSALARVLSGSVSINQNIISTRVVGQREIIKPELGLTDYRFTLTVLMSESSYETLRTSAYGGGSTPDAGTGSVSFPTTDELRIEFSEGSGSGDRNIIVHLDECVIGNMSQPVSAGNNLVQVTFTGMANKGKDNDPIEYWTVS